MTASSHRFRGYNSFLDGNPINPWLLSWEQYAFLANLTNFTLQQSAFASCAVEQQLPLHQYQVCLDLISSTPTPTPEPAATSSPSPTEQTSGGSSASGASQVVYIVASFVLAIVIAVILFKIIRRKSGQLAVSSTSEPPATSGAHRHFTAMESDVDALQHQSHPPTDSPQRPAASSALHRNNGSAVWVDDELLSWRVDYDGIKLKQRLSSSGPFVEVWIATYRLDTVAAKVLRPRHEASQGPEAIDPIILNKFLMEAKMLSRLDHPRIVAFYGVAWRSESEVLAAMEFMPQLDVHTYLQTLQSREWTLRKLQIALDVVEALVYIHSLQPALIHCSLKSSNVLLNELLHAKLSDFGVAKYLHSKTSNRAYDRDEDANMDRIRHVVSQGTRALPWVAPEVILGNAEYSEAVDVYAFGVLLSELDTHELPYRTTRGKNRLPIGDHEIQKRVAAGKLRPPLSPSCPSDIRLLAANCLATDPSDRPSSVQLAYAANKLVAKAMTTAPAAELREPVVVVGPGQRPLAGTSYSLGSREADEVDWAIKTVGQQYAAM